MATFKVGDKGRVVAHRDSDHEYPVGAVVICRQRCPSGGKDNLPYRWVIEDRAKDRHYYGHWLYDGEVVPIADETAEPAFDLLAAMTGKPLRFRSGCDVRFVAYIPDAKPHCQLVLLNPATGNVVTRFANGKASTEPYAEPGDILIGA